VLHLTRSSTHHVVIDGLVLDAANTAQEGVKITYSGTDPTTASHHIRIQNCEIMNATGHGVLGGGRGFNEFINNDVHHNGSSDQYDHGFYIGAVNNLFERNMIHDNKSHGIHIYNQTSFAAHNNVVRNNVVFRNGSRGILLASGNDNLAYNNLSFENGVAKAAAGITIGSGARAKVYNNTVFDNPGYCVELGISGAPSGSVVKNNICHQNGVNIVGKNVGDTIITHNLTTADPKFVSASGGDFHLQSTSPAINAGTTLTEVAKDFDGVSRPQGGSYDIGAFER
jgi:parallel beta-helix repeat protein